MIHFLRGSVWKISWLCYCCLERNGWITLVCVRGLFVCLMCYMTTANPHFDEQFWYWYKVTTSWVCKLISHFWTTLKQTFFFWGEDVPRFTPFGTDNLFCKLEWEIKSNIMLLLEFICKQTNPYDCGVAIIYCMHILLMHIYDLNFE